MTSDKELTEVTVLEAWLSSMEPSGLSSRSSMSNKPADHL